MPKRICNISADDTHELGHVTAHKCTALGLLRSTHLRSQREWDDLRKLMEHAIELVVTHVHNPGLFHQEHQLFTECLAHIQKQLRPAVAAA